MSIFGRVFTRLRDGVGELPLRGWLDPARNRQETIILVPPTPVVDIYNQPSIATYVGASIDASTASRIAYMDVVLAMGGYAQGGANGVLPDAPVRFWIQGVGIGAYSIRSSIQWEPHPGTHSAIGFSSVPDRIEQPTHPNISHMYGTNYSVRTCVPLLGRLTSSLTFYVGLLAEPTDGHVAMTAHVVYK